MSDKLDFSLRETASPAELCESVAEVKRLKWIVTKLGPDGFYFFQDGRFSRYMFQEAIQSFINGQFIASIVLAFSFIERSLAGRFFEVGRTDLERATAEVLLREARLSGWLSETEEKLFNNLRELRNTVAHFRDPGSTDRPEIRAILSAKQPYEMLENQAREVLDAAIRLLGKTAI